MNKIVSTDKRIFMCLVGPSESGKTQLIFDMLHMNTFQQPFDHIYYCYRHWQTIYKKFASEIPNIRFIQVSADEHVVDSVRSVVESRHDGGEKKKKKTLAIFDDLAEEILKDEKFSNLSTSGRHNNISIIFIKHNLYQQGKFSVTIDKNTTHLVLLKNPRMGKQLKILGGELGNSKFLEDCYEKAVKTEKYGHLMIDLSTNCPEQLRYASNIVPPSPTAFWVPKSQLAPVFIDDADAYDLYMVSKK